MSRRLFSSVLKLIGILVVSTIHLCGQNASVGIFEDHNDVGTVLHAARSSTMPRSTPTRSAGSGENMWFATDTFQFVWKKVSGDVTLTADIGFLTKTGNPHKKAALMFRQSLDADSVYADVALHGAVLPRCSIVMRRERSRERFNPTSPAQEDCELRSAATTFTWR